MKEHLKKKKPKTKKQEKLGRLFPNSGEKKIVETDNI